MMLWPRTLVALCLASAGTGTQMPEALRLAQDSRSTNWLQTARIEYVVHGTQQDNSKYDLFFTWKCAYDDYITVNRGDEEGVVMRNERGEPAPVTYNNRIHHLVQGGDVWEHTEDAPFGYQYGPSLYDSFRQHNLRHLGLSPRGIAETVDKLEDVARQYDGENALKYTTATENGLQVVTARSPNGAFKWWIDPEKDWSILRTETWRNEQRIGENRITVKECDGHWFPVRYEEYRLAAGDLEPSTVIELLSVELNRPEHPQFFTPADIGIEPGMMITQTEVDSARIAFWDGTKLISSDEFHQRAADGTLDTGPTLAREFTRLKVLAERRAEREAAAGGATSQPTSARSNVIRLTWQTFESEWEAYTRAFIAEHALDDGQTERAWAILKDCQTEGQTYIARQRTALDRLEQDYTSLRQAATTGAGDLGARLERLEESRQKLVAPLNRIFEEHLKPRLDRLLTRQQRAAAQQIRKTPSTQPARRPPAGPP